MAKSGSIPAISYGPLSPTRYIPELRARETPEHCQVCSYTTKKSQDTQKEGSHSTNASKVHLHGRLNWYQACNHCTVLPHHTWILWVKLPFWISVMGLLSLFSYIPAFYHKDWEAICLAFCWVIRVKVKRPLYFILFLNPNWSCTQTLNVVLKGCCKGCWSTMRLVICRNHLCRSISLSLCPLF